MALLIVPYALHKLLLPLACHSSSLVRQNLEVMSPSSRSPIALHNAIPHMRRGLHPISMLLALLLRKPIVRPIKRQIRNTRMPLDARRLLQPARQIARDLAENGNLALDDVFFRQVLMWPEMFSMKRSLAPSSMTFSQRARAALKSSGRISERKATAPAMKWEWVLSRSGVGFVSDGAGGWWVWLGDLPVVRWRNWMGEMELR